MVRRAQGVSRDEIRALTRTSDAPGWFAVVTTWLVIAGAFAVLARWPGPPTFIGAVVVLGGRQLALAVLMHEAAHGTLFSTRVLNEVVTDWVCARPVWSDVARYRRHHLAHHAHTGTERDPDLGLALAGPMTRGSLARKIARDLAGASGVRRVIGLFLIDAELLTYNVGGGVRRLPWRGLGAHAGAAARAPQTTAPCCARSRRAGSREWSQRGQDLGPRCACRPVTPRGLAQEVVHRRRGRDRRQPGSCDVST